VAYISDEMLGLSIEIYGQTGRTFNLRCKEHIQAIRSNCSKSGYLNHILNMGHTWYNYRYYGCHEDRKEEQTYEHLKKVIFTKLAETIYM
jgi:hypothetical protein